MSSLSISSGQTSQGLTAGRGDLVVVLSGGTASETHLLGGQLVVQGGIAVRTDVRQGGSAFVPDGVASSTVVYQGGQLIVSGRGIAKNSYVSSGGSALVAEGGVLSETTVSTNGIEVIMSGGVASSSVVNAGGRLVVSSGGVTRGANLTSGGIEAVSAGGVASSTIVSNGGSLLAYAGGVTSSAAVRSGGVAIVSSGGTAIAASINGGVQTVSSGGVTSGSILAGVGSEIVLLGGMTVGTVVQGLGVQYVSSGGVTSNTVVSGTTAQILNNIFTFSAWQDVRDGGIANDTTVNSLGFQSVSSGGVANHTIVSSGGSLLLSDGGVADSAVANLGGAVTVFSGGIANGADISSGSIFVSNGGIANQTTLNHGLAIVSVGGVMSGGQTRGGILTVSAGGITIGLTAGRDAIIGTATGNENLEDSLWFVSAGGLVSQTAVERFGYLTVLSGGEARETHVAGTMTVASGGVANLVTLGPGLLALAYSPRINISSGGVANGITVTSRSLVKVLSGGVASGSLINKGGSFAVSSGGTANSTMVNSGGTLLVSSGGITADTQLVSGGTIDLQYLAFASGGTASLDSATNVLTVSQGGQTTTLGLGGLYTGRYFHLNQDADGSTLLTQDANPACYAHGTLILTGRGEVPVEALAIGDTAVTASGAHRPIRWLGRRAYAGRFLHANPGVQPIQFRAGCLGNGLPRRDLRVSPNHAMLLDGVLVPASALANDTTITRERALARVDYVHVELDSHDVLLAEGAPSESFVDDDSRGIFHNAAEWKELYPERKRVPALFCAPRVEDGEQLEAIRQRLAALTDKRALVA